MTLSLADYGILAAIVGMPIGAVALYLRTIKDDADRFRREMFERLGATNDRVGSVERELRRIEENKVDKADWVRNEMASRNRIERLGDGIAELSGRIQSDWGVAAAINRLANRGGAEVESG